MTVSGKVAPTTCSFTLEIGECKRTQPSSRPLCCAPTSPCLGLCSTCAEMCVSTCASLAVRQGPDIPGPTQTLTQRTFAKIATALCSTRCFRCDSLSRVCQSVQSMLPTTSYSQVPKRLAWKRSELNVHEHIIFSPCSTVAVEFRSVPSVGKVLPSLSAASPVGAERPVLIKPSPCVRPTMVFGAFKNRQNRRAATTSPATRTATRTATREYLRHCQVAPSNGLRSRCVSCILDSL